MSYEGIFMQPAVHPLCAIAVQARKQVDPEIRKQHRGKSDHRKDRDPNPNKSDPSKNSSNRKTPEKLPPRKPTACTPSSPK